VATLKEMSSLHLYDFGIFIELMPDEEEKVKLENNIQMALQQKTIDLEDAIDIREIRSVRLANQMLKIRRKKKLQRDQEIQQQNMQQQAMLNQQSAQAAAQGEVQKNQALTQSKIELEQVKAQINTQRMVYEAEMKKELMKLEFDYNMQLKGMEVQGQKDKDTQKEDRKDERTRIQASQQSELINQRNNKLPPKKFESSGNDIMSGDFNLDAFEPV